MYLAVFRRYSVGGDSWHSCRLRDDDYCFIHFAYNYGSDDVQVQRTKGFVAIRIEIFNSSILFMRFSVLSAYVNIQLFGDPKVDAQHRPS